MKNNSPGSYWTFRTAWTIVHVVVVAAAVGALLTWALNSHTPVRIFESSKSNVLDAQQRVSNAIPWPWAVNDDGAGSSSRSSSGSAGESQGQSGQQHQVIGN